jgi:hypothetical protein
MKRSLILSAVLAVAACACWSLTTAEAAAGRGSIRGFIKDATGKPLVGAAVLVLMGTEESEDAKVIKKASTDGEGKFIALGIAPGKYRVKAEAAGFRTVELAADVQPNKATVFDSIRLRRVGTLAEETNLNLDPKYASRRAKPTVFQHTSGSTTNTEDPPVVLAQAGPEIHGAAQLFGQFSPGADVSPLGLANFALTQQIAKGASVAIGGQVGIGQNAPQRLQVLTTAHAGDRHRLQVALGYARFTFARNTDNKDLGQFSISATDTWQVSGPVLLVYGLEFSRFTKGAVGTSVKPRIGISVDAHPRTRVFADLVPGSSEDVQSKADTESGDILFTEPRPVAFRGTDPVADRSHRLQFGAEHLLSDGSSVEVMAFFDSAAGHTVGLLAIPLDGVTSETQLAQEFSGNTRGLRVVYHRRLTKCFNGSVGYAFGRGQKLGSADLESPSGLFRNDNFHVVSARIDANFVGTGTKLSTVIRFAPEQALFAIDPFQGQINTYDPNINVVVTQDLPEIGLVPGHWQAVLDLRNLLDQQIAIADEFQELSSSRFHRLVRVGLAVRF